MTTKTTAPNPSCSGLLDRKVRKQLDDYRLMGYVGFLIGEAVAYIELLEAELERREKESAV